MQDYIEIKERIDPGIRYALIEQFPRPVTAFLEITDNSIATRRPNEPIEIRIGAQHGKISIADKGGTGMNIEELQKFLTWGAGERQNIFRFHGQGGKAALAHLANNFTLHSTPADLKHTYRATVIDWPRNLEEERIIRFEILDPIFDFPTVSFNLSGLRKRIAPADLKHSLAETYRPLLARDEVQIWVNHSKIIPVEIPFAERTEFVEETKVGLVKGWVGLKEENSQIRGGIRCYTRGRLVSKREFFGLDQPSIDFEHLIGEVDLWFVPVTTLKIDFDQASNEWFTVTQVIQEKLKPYTRRTFHLDKDLGLLDREFTKLRSKVLDVFREADETFGLGGRKPPKTREGEKPAMAAANHIMKHRKLCTPRPPKVVGDARRLGSFDLSILDEAIRSHYDKQRDVVLVNSQFPAYLSNVRLRRYDAHPWFGYVVETIALEAYTQDGTPPTEIKERVNHLLKIAHQMTGLNS